MENAIADQIVHASLSAASKDELAAAIDESLEVPPIAQATAMALIARYCELPVHHLENVQDWMTNDDLLRTATNHAWLEKGLSQCLRQVGYTVSAGRQLNEGGARLWVDIECQQALAPSHQITIDIICSPHPLEYRVAALLYDMETSKLLQQTHWFLLATHGHFSPFSQMMIKAAKERVPYIVNRIEGPEIATLLQQHAQGNTQKVAELLRQIANK